MTIFTDTHQLYHAAGLLFSRMLVDYPEAITPLYRSKLIARLSTSAPAGQIWVNARHNPLQTSFGNQSLRPELDIHLSADTLHLILMDQLPLTQAVGNGAVKVRGPIFRFTALGDLFTQGKLVYPAVLQDLGITY